MRGLVTPEYIFPIFFSTNYSLLLLSVFPYKYLEYCLLLLSAGVTGAITINVMPSTKNVHAVEVNIERGAKGHLTPGI